jgi:isoamylase
MRNMAAALLVSHGVPMLCMGDEYGHTKRGNNNTYCHDSPLNWMDWSQAEKDEQGLVRFVRGLIQLRKMHPELQRTQFVNDRDIQWHGVNPNEPDWSETSRLVAYSLEDYRGGGLFVAFNSAHLPKMLSLPKRAGRVWQQIVDTSKVAPYDILIPDEELSAADVNEARAVSAMWTAEHAYPLLPWSCIVLESVPEETVAVVKAI